MNCCDRKWSTCLLASLIVGLAVLACPKAPVFGQQVVSPLLLGASRTTAVDDRTLKIDLALEAAGVAAESELFDLSFEAVKRICSEGPPVSKPQIQSSLLGGQANTSTRIVSGRPGYQVPEATVRYAAKLFSIVDKWKSKQAPSERIAEALDQIVFPAGRPNEIMLFSNVPPIASNSYNYEFSFAKPKPVRYLSFELIDLAAKNKTLPSLIEKLEKMRSLPSSQPQAVAMLVYAKRVSGQADAAAKTLEELLKNPVNADHTMPLYHGLTKPLSELGESAAVSASALMPLLNKLLKENIMRMDIREAVLQQLKEVIKSDDQAAFDSYVAMVVDSINQMPNNNQSTINYLLENFYRNLGEECKRQGKAALAVEISTRAVDARADLGQGSAYTVSNFVELKPEARLKALRKMFVERPIVKFEQFSFSQNFRNSNVPEFFHLTDNSYKQFLPYEGAKSISLLDLLLNQTEAEGDVSALTKELMANASENDDVKRFLAVWLNFRNEMRGKPVDVELAKLAKFESEQEYFDWWKLLPTPAAVELLSFRLRTVAPSPEMRVAFESRFANENNEQPMQAAIEMRYQQRLAVDKTLVNANRLKHWVVSYEPINWQSEVGPPVWTINEKQQAECFGGAWYAQLIFRYPLPVNSTIKITADRGEKKTDGLYCGGVSMMSFDERQSACYVMASNVRVLGQFTAQTAKPTRVLEGTFKDNSMSLKIGDKSVELLEYGAKTVPFVGLAGYGARQSTFSEVAITSPSAIPREVSLLDEGLNGWSAYLFGHALPKLSGHIETDANDSQTNYSEQQTAAPIWNMVDDELRAGTSTSEEDETKTTEDSEGNETASSNDEDSAENPQVSQSNMSYARPLCEGEQIEYEFFHQSDAQNASPSLGQIAYLIRDDKITLRWISTGNEQRKPDKETNYLGDDPAAEVLAPFKLEANAWNRVQLRIEGGKVVLSIGATDVYRRPLEKETIAKFGFYCDPKKDQVRVRKAVLKGNWPTELPKDLWELQ